MSRSTISELEASKGGWANRIRNAERELADTREQLTGALENASSIAVRLGVDCDNMTPAEEWHASVKAIEQTREQLQKMQQFNLKAWKPIETAPLDRWILGADQDKWMRIKWQPRSAFWSGWPTYEPPTHWMIPDTPKSAVPAKFGGEK